MPTNTAPLHQDVVNQKANSDPPSSVTRRSWKLLGAGRIPCKMEASSNILSECTCASTTAVSGWPCRAGTGSRCKETLPGLVPKLRTRLPPLPSPTTTCLKQQRQGLWPNSRRHRTIVFFFSLLRAVYEQVCSVICGQALDYTFADLRLVCSCCRLSLTKLILTGNHDSAIHIPFELYLSFQRPVQLLLRLSDATCIIYTGVRPTKFLPTSALRKTTTWVMRSR